MRHISSDRLGARAAIAVCVVGVAYLPALAAGFAIHGFDEPIDDPVLAVMEILTVLSAPLLVVVVAAIHDYAAAERKVYGVIALAFTALFAGVTLVVHFIELTALRQQHSAGIVWPSPVYALELLGWDVFLGLGLVFAAHVFSARPDRYVRRGLLLSGALCLAGTIGPMVGDMRLQRIGVFGYAAVLPVVCFMLARLFRRNRAVSD